MRCATLILGLFVCLAPRAAPAQDGPVRLLAPPQLVETGLFQYILPRFTLKTRVRVALVDDAERADLVLGDQGRALFAGADQTWRLTVRHPDDPDTARFADWLTGEIGRNTVLSYAPEGDALFSPPRVQEKAVAAIEVTGDARLGRKVSRAKCARCHTVDPDSRMSDIGSTPSFYVLRSLPDWQDRFTAFYALNPHPAFTQVEDVTLPFHQSRPPPIAPISMTLDEIDAVLAYVAGLEPADLGEPIRHQ